MNECELYEPIKKLFDDLGYKVNAEVKGCDITATKEDELIVIEMKKNLSTQLLTQALERQKIGAKVYAAIPTPKNYSPKKYGDTIFLLKKLELGLIFVYLRGKHSYAQIVLEPEEFYPPRKNYERLKKIKAEITGRTVDTNTGGVCGKKIATAYTEKCIHIACLLDKYGPLNAPKLKALGADEKCANILRSNAYGWFKKVGRGVFEITALGARSLMEYPELEKYYTDLIDNKS